MKLDPDAQGQADLAGLGTQLSLHSELREQMALLFPEDESMHPLECPGAAVGLPIGWTEDPSQPAQGTICTAVGQLFLQNSVDTAKGQMWYKRK